MQGGVAKFQSKPMSCHAYTRLGWALRDIPRAFNIFLSSVVFLPKLLSWLSFASNNIRSHMQAMANRTRIPPAVWDEHKALLQELYIHKDLKLSDVKEEMRKRGFQASNQQYNRAFREWGFFKDLKREEWQLICQKISERKPRLSAVFVRGQEISQERLDRGFRRHVPLSFLYTRSTLEERDYIRVCTPVIPNAPSMDIIMSNAPSDRMVVDAPQITQQDLSTISFGFDEMVVDTPKTIQQEVSTLSFDYGELPTLRMADLLDHNCKLGDHVLYSI